jgi:hypothetical protein
LLIRMLCDFFKPRPRLEAEILILRHQLNVLQQRRCRRSRSICSERYGSRAPRRAPRTIAWPQQTLDLRIGS